MRDAAWLERQLSEHLADVRELYARVIYAHQPMYYGPMEGGYAGPEEQEERAPQGAVNLTRYLDRCAPQLAISLAGRARPPRARAA